MPAHRTARAPLRAYRVSAPRDACRAVRVKSSKPISPGGGPEKPEGAPATETFIPGGMPAPPMPMPGGTPAPPRWA